VKVQAAPAKAAEPVKVQAAPAKAAEPVKVQAAPAKAAEPVKVQAEPAKPQPEPNVQAPPPPVAVAVVNENPASAPPVLEEKPAPVVTPEPAPSSEPTQLTLMDFGAELPPPSTIATTNTEPTLQLELLPEPVEELKRVG
jgi:hypothetical protein